MSNGGEETKADVFARLVQELEETSLAASEELDDQARVSLVHLFDIVVREQGTFVFETHAVDPATCPNCGGEPDSVRSPYCGERCRTVAAFVRQSRNALATGSIFEAEKQIGLGQVFWGILGGGYPRREGLILPAARKKVIERDGGECKICGAPATTVEHVRTSCNRPINLRAVCAKCSRTKAFGDPSLLADPSCLALRKEFALRVSSPIAIRCCDDAETWDWREYVAERRRRLADLG